MMVFHLLAVLCATICYLHMMKNPRFLILAFLFMLHLQPRAQQKEAPTPPLPLYGSTTPGDVKRVMDQILVYVDEVTPYRNR